MVVELHNLIELFFGGGEYCLSILQQACNCQTTDVPLHLPNFKRHDHHRERAQKGSDSGHPPLRTKMVIRLFIAFHVGAKLEIGKRL